MSSGFAHGAPTGEINADKGVIEGVSVCTIGEAKGHGVNLDSEFIEAVRAFGASKKQGLKARYGHPNMSSTALGTFLGRFKNFTVDGDQVRADLFLSNEAKNTPQGDLYAYVMGMATNEPDMFGTSIVFTPGRTYQWGDEGEKIIVDQFGMDDDKPLFVECEALHACDAVDEPAANEGLFSAFSKETIAGQITEFLDLHPDIWKQLESNPAIVEALARYGDNMDGFMNRYRDYRSHNGKDITMSEKPTDSEQLEEVVEEPSAAATPEEQEETETPAETESTEETTDEPETPAEELESEPEASTVSLTAERDELRTLLSDRGEEVERLTGELSTSTEEVVTLTERAVKAETELAAATRKLTALTDGQKPVSTDAAETELSTTDNPFADARRTKK